MSHRNTAGDGNIRAGNTNRIGDSGIESETSSIIKPPWMRRKRMVPVVGVLRMEVYIACSAGVSDSLDAGGRGRF